MPAYKRNEVRRIERAARKLVLDFLRRPGLFIGSATELSELVVIALLRERKRALREAAEAVDGTHWKRKILELIKEKKRG